VQQPEGAESQEAMPNNRALQSLKSIQMTKLKVKSSIKQQ